MTGWHGSHSHGFPPRIRAAILQRDPICRRCHRAPSTDADHITPVAAGGTHTLANGQGLCHACHTRKTQAEASAARRRAAAQGRHPPEPHPGLT